MRRDFFVRRNKKRREYCELLQFAANYNAVIRAIYNRKNPNATVVAVGVYNPLASVSVSSDFALKLDSIFAANVVEINAIISASTLLYDNFYYADVVGTETYPGSLTDETFMNDLVYLIHPNVDGYRFMADRILAQLVNTDVSKELDAGPDKVTAVSLNGLPVLKYEYKDGVLTVPCKNKLASSLSVTEVRGKCTYTVNYALRWTDNGYVVTKLNEVNLTKTVTSVAVVVTSALKSLAKSIKLW